jgi:Dyp-type peroxidase family
MSTTLPKPVPSKSRSVLGATEITLLAPLKRGLVPALDSRSYDSRAALVLRTLQGLGISRREVEPTPGLDEVADAIRSIRSFRLAVVGQPPQMLLSVSFDGGWEPYMRRIWRDLGALLDLIFCNCEGYLLSRNHEYADYAAWVRRAQVETGFYYEGSPLTAADWEQLRIAAGQPEPAAAADAGGVHEQARAALVGLYRLSDMYLPGTEDGRTLLAAARLLLRSLATTSQPPPAGWLRTATEAAAWRWFMQPQEQEKPQSAPDRPDLGNVQGGILEGHAKLAHGCLALVELDGPAAAAVLIEQLQERILSAAAPPFLTEGPLFLNLAFTCAGLRAAGVDEATLEQLPLEFREGMEARASVLGDWEHNHPMNWTLPAPYERGAPPVSLVRVHALVQLSLAAPPSMHWQDMDSEAKAPLSQAVRQLHDALQPAGGRVLAVQPMQRFAESHAGPARGHFNFADGLSQPGLAAPDRPARDTVPPGDLLLGYRNGLGDRPALRGRLWMDGTFLVVRKLRQYPERLREQVPDAADRARLMGRHEGGHNLINGAGAEDNDFDYTGDAQGTKCPLYAHVRRANPRATRPDLMHLPRILRRGMSYGPRLNGDQPAQADVDRGLVFMAFNASIAEQFELVQAWLAGANSSGEGSFSGLRDPLLGVAREGDPRRYEWVDEGPPLRKRAVVLKAEEPLVTLQWGLYAFVPSLAALKELQTRAADAAHEDAIGDVEAPPAGTDREALQRKRDARVREEALLVARGSAVIAQLLQAEQAQGVDTAAERWKLALEDLGARMSGTSRAVWAAIRKVHGGVLRTPYGVLVCSKSMVDEVFANADGRYSTTGYNTRLAKSIGEIYLGRDEGGPASAYRQEADAANGAVMAVTMAQAYESAYRHSADVLEGLLRAAAPATELAVEVKDLVDGLLAALCLEWFGVPEGRWVLPGGWHWLPEAQATCPGHFHSPSRYTFQPRPGDAARDIGERHGQALKSKMLGFVRAVRAQPALQGRLGAQLFAAFPDDPAADGARRDALTERLATTLIGVMMGFLPPADGNLRSVLFEWVEDRSLWQHQAALRREAGRVAAQAAAAGGAAAPPASLATAERVLAAPLARTMQLRPVPEVVWRTALRAHVLGAGAQAVSVRAGDTVVVSIVSAMHEDLMAERADPFVVFGGRRKPARDGDAHPTHACPGYDMAQGVMLGFLAALMERATLRPALSPLALRISAA